MKAFNPTQSREALDGDVGYRWTLSRNFEEARNMRGLASSAGAFLNMAVKCLLVGYDDAASQLSKRAFEWLTVAIKEKERPRAYGEYGTEAQWHRDLAMCNWLLHAVHDVENLKRYVEYEDRFLMGSKIGRDKTNVSLALLGYVDAGAYQQALERFANAGLQVPESLDSIRSEGQLCYVICRHRLRQEYLEADVKAAAEKFLKRSVNGWLVDGHFLRAAQWMKVVHWREGNVGLSPKGAVLKCYEYVSDVTPPTPTKPGP
ncbi:MAG TPA: hypothetical protein VGI81_10710 [Tepidisphaeraceae bacterium]|jgi:hypothetical protein